MEGAKHNLPDVDAQEAAKEVQNLASELTEEDILLVLISGKNSNTILFGIFFNLNTTKPTRLSLCGQNICRRRLGAVTCTHPTHLSAGETGRYA